MFFGIKRALESSHLKTKHFLSIKSPTLIFGLQDWKSKKTGRRDCRKFFKVVSKAIEIHGEIIPDGLLEWADRVGMGVIIVPRCIGRTINGTPENMKEIANQDVRLLKQDKKTSLCIVCCV